MHDVCVGTDRAFPSNQCGCGKQDEKKGWRRTGETLEWLILYAEFNTSLPVKKEGLYRDTSLKV